MSSSVSKRSVDELRTLLGGGGVLRRNANTRRWYHDGNGGLTDQQIDLLIKRELLRFTDMHADQIELVDDPERNR